MDEITLDMKSKMAGTIENYKTNLKALRTGRANPAILEGIMVDYYGDKIALMQISAVSVPEPRQLLIKPYDKNDLKAIATAINASNIGLVPNNDGTAIRLVIPPLTEERRREIVKQGKKYAEECKVVIRNIRRDYIDLVRADEGVSEDVIKRIEKEIQEATDEQVKLVDAIMAEKEKEIMAI